jgi:hypothetical protein
MSKSIRKFQKYTGAKGQAMNITHVAEVVYGNYVYESTTMNKWAGKSGVQVNPFDQWLANYNGDVYVRKWDFEVNGEYLCQENEFMQDHRDDKYENGIPGALELFLCGLRLHRYVRRFFPDYTPKFTSQPHCNELIGKKKKFHGQLSEEAVPNRMPPWIWWEKIDELATVPIGQPIMIKQIL